MSASTLLKIQARKEKKSTLNNCRTRTAKAEAQKEYTVAHQKVRRSIRRDKRNHVDRLATQAEKAATQGNMKDLYDTTRKLAAHYKQADIPIKDKQGKTLTTTEEQLERWAEHFSELNRPAPEDLPDIPPAAAGVTYKMWQTI